jgi:uroporphyrinogen-III decarboxylase
MNRRERLMATLAGRPVDRPAVSFYEIGGFAVNPNDPDVFNIYNSPDWKPLLKLAEDETDLIRMRAPLLSPVDAACRRRYFQQRIWIEGRSRFTRTILRVTGREMTSLSRRDADIDTVWEIEHLLKDADDLRAFLELPEEALDMVPDVSNLLTSEREVGDRGLLMVEQEDPLCAAAQLFSMEDYLVTALCKQDLFDRLLDKLARPLYRRVKTIAHAFPGRLWRIYGPEYATEPYLPPTLFQRYVVGYTQPIIHLIHDSGGWARIHCHGRLSAVLPMIVGMGADAIDPVEPPPQGDVSLDFVRHRYGKNLVLFGNIEIAAIENLPPDQFESVVARTLREGTEGEGKGFVLMPSASPYGRTITPTTMANYQTMARLVREFRRR